MKELDSYFEGPAQVDYLLALDYDKIAVPTTLADFEALMGVLVTRLYIPDNNYTRVAVCGFLHAMPRDQGLFTLSAMGGWVLKAICNALTYKIHQEIEDKQKQEKAASEQPSVQTTPG
jgi:hypothetical protein